MGNARYGNSCYRKSRYGKSRVWKKSGMENVSMAKVGIGKLSIGKVGYAKRVFRISNLSVELHKLCFKPGSLCLELQCLSIDLHNLSL